MSDNIVSLKRVKRLICACCGESTIGRQWYNRDTGYGLCVACVDYCKAKLEDDEFKDSYGVQGVHFDVKDS